jgi:hypothetical protein
MCHLPANHTLSALLPSLSGPLLSQYLQSNGGMPVAIERVILTSLSAVPQNRTEW